MQRITSIIFIALFLLNSCMDKVDPFFRITINNQSSLNLDSFYISNDTLFKDKISIESFGINDLNKELELNVYDNKFRIKALLADSILFYSQTIRLENGNYNYEAIITDKGFEIRKLYSNYIIQWIIIFLVLLFLIQITKIWISYRFLELKDRILYAIKYTILNIVYFIIICLINELLGKNSFIIFLIVAFVIPYISDLIIHKVDKNISNGNIEKTITITNLIFLIVVSLIFGSFVFEQF